MALLWIDGFDNYGTGSVQVPAASFAWRYGGSSVDLNDLTTPRVEGSGRSMMTDYGSWTFTPELTDAERTLIVGFGFKLITGVSSGTTLNFRNRESLGVHLAIRGRTGEFDVYGGPGAGQNYLGTTSGARVGFNQWTYIEVKVYCDSTAGTVDIQSDGVSVLSLSSVNTQRITENYYDRVWILPDIGPGYGHAIDDLYICDGSGAVNNDFLGPCKVLTLRPESDVVGETDWTPQTPGNHYAMVDEVEADEDSTYVESDVSTNQDLWEYEDTPAAIGDIYGIQICTDCRITEAEVFGLKTPAKLGATTSEGSVLTVGSQDYLSTLRVMETDPDGNPWTDSNLDSTQFGVKVA